MKNITVVIPIFNEEYNIPLLVSSLHNEFDKISNIYFEILFIDNSSSDKSQMLIEKYCSQFKSIKAIFNIKNFGAVRSPCYAIKQVSSDAVILYHADLQIPTSVISDLINTWEANKINAVLAVKIDSNISLRYKLLKKIYYFILSAISDHKIIKNATGVGLYDRVVLDFFIKLNDPYPFLRTFVPELGFPYGVVGYYEVERMHGKSKSNLKTFFSEGIQGVVSNSFFPIKFIFYSGLLLSFFSFLIGIFYLLLKMIYWDSIPFGFAPIIISLFILFGILFLFIGVIGEYISNILLFLRNRPLVIEEKRINF